MAKIDFKISTDMTAGSIWYGDIYSYSSSQIVIWQGYLGGDAVKYKGSGFQYNSYTVVAGTVTGFDYAVNVQSTSKYTTQFTISQLSLSAVAVRDIINSYDYFSLIEYSASGNDTFNGSSGADHIIAFSGNDTVNGNAGNDILEGSEGVDILNGGAGADTLIGGTGDDIYVVDNTGDVVTEISSEGTDLVQSSITFSLATIANVENITLTGTKAINATGNSLDNTLTGNKGANVLNDDAGNDSIAGMTGNDSINGGSGDDWIWGGGFDDWEGVFKSSGNDTLIGGAGNDFLDGGDGNDSLNGGDGDDGLFGRGGNDTIIGGDGNDYLSSGGGKDLLTGGLGDDDFSIDIDSLSASAVTTVTDFNKLGADSITLSTDKDLYIADNDYGVFWHEVTDSEFYAGSGFKKTITAGQYYVYDTATGTLYYDADSFGGKAAVAICILTGQPTLSASDITVTND